MNGKQSAMPGFGPTICPTAIGLQSMTDPGSTDRFASRCSWSMAVMGSQRPLRIS